MNNEDVIRSMLETLVAKVTSLDSKVTSLDSKVTSLDSKVASLEAKVDSIDKTVARIEIDHGNKLDALFDSYEQLYDISGEIRQKIVALETTQAKHEMKFSRYAADQARAR